eukprot:2569579-Rhodomonas_salina.1
MCGTDSGYAATLCVVRLCYYAVCGTDPGYAATSPNTPSTPSPRMVLSACARYPMSGTETVYGAVPCCAMSGTDHTMSGTNLVHGAPSCYAMSGTHLVHGATSCYAMSGTEIAYDASSCYAMSGMCYAMSSTNVAYGPKLSPPSISLNVSSPLRAATSK